MGGHAAPGMRVAWLMLWIAGEEDAFGAAFSSLFSNRTSSAAKAYAGPSSPTRRSRRRNRPGGAPPCFAIVPPNRRVQTSYEDPPAMMQCS